MVPTILKDYSEGTLFYFKTIAMNTIATTIMAEDFMLVNGNSKEMLHIDNLEH
jgi:hypothetical protein